MKFSVPSVAPCDPSAVPVQRWISMCGTEMCAFAHAAGDSWTVLCPPAGQGRVTSRGRRAAGHSVTFCCKHPETPGNLYVFATR